MTATHSSEPRTLVDAMQKSMADALRSPEGVADSVALLWTDASGEWQELVPTLQSVLRQLYVLGPYDPSKRTGPTIWLKCVVDRTIPEVSPLTGIVPILYLPRVSWQELRAGNDCPAELQPLIELQYRGCVWHQRNGRDWSVGAFFVSEDGLGLEVTQDASTQEALLRALPLLADTDIDSLKGRRLITDDFDKLAVSDPVRDLLRWMSNPDGFRAGLDDGRWQAFRNRCRSEFDLDTEEEDTSGATTALKSGGGRWDDVWQRFCEAPRLYPGIKALLREPAAGQGELAFDQSRNPTANEEAEKWLRRGLEEVCSLPHADARNRVLALEAEHGARRGWVWAQLGDSPLALALEPLARLADLAKSAIGGTNLEAMAETYASDGWQCDRAALDALACSMGPSDMGSVHAVVRVLYEPWLDRTSRHFQKLVSERGGDLRGLVRGVTEEKDTCILFVDGLRFDVGAALKEKLERQYLRVRCSHRISPLPTVTPTAKPAASPAHQSVVGAGAPSDFMPVLVGSGQPAVSSRLRDAIRKLDVKVIEPDELPLSAETAGGGWAEIGRLDELGHKLGVGLAAQISSEVDRIADRVSELLEFGWLRVRVVTDHGWLLLPDDLPKFELPPYLVETKWARCATVKGQSTPAAPIYVWQWNPEARFASPPGIACFSRGYEYAHGGVSLQECVVPELVVERAETAVAAKISKVEWRGMRCRVHVIATRQTVQVDLRLNWKQPASSLVASAKQIGPGGEVSLVVEDDTHEGAAATVVVFDATDQRVLDRRPTTVGENP